MPILPILTRKIKAFTLVEVLCVLALVTLLAALLFPAFNGVRARTQQTICVSQLGQLGKAVAMYTQDWDGQFPLGGDALDLNTEVWKPVEGGKFWPTVSALSPLPVVLSPYVQNQAMWRCPSDRGFDVAGIAHNTALDGRPSSFEKFGSSYFYRTELALRHITISGATAFMGYPPYTQIGPEGINVLADGSGNWHSTQGPERFNVLMADGHVKNIPTSAYAEMWLLMLSPPQS